MSRSYHSAACDTMALVVKLELVSIIALAIALELGAQDPDELLTRGQRLEAAGDLPAALSSYEALVHRFPDDWRGPMLRGQVSFRLGRNDSALADFDRVVELHPEIEPELWQRGIAQYYARQYEACARQFELHRTVNPNDVENAAWHFLCRARTDGVAAARAALLPVGPDARIPMGEVYRMLEGTLEPEAVLEAARTSGAESRRELWSFYAELYVGLYLEALGDHESAERHLRAAARAGVGGDMGDVARIHLSLR